MLAINRTDYLNPYTVGSSEYVNFERMFVLQMLTCSAIPSRSIPALFIRAHNTIHKQMVVSHKSNIENFVKWAQSKDYIIVGSTSEPLAVTQDWQPVAQYDDDDVFAKDSPTAKAIVAEAGLKLRKAEELTIVERLVWDAKEGEIGGTAFELDTSDIRTDPELYPFIEGGVVKLIDDFIASPAKILMLIGIPGGGKSSLVKYMATRFKNVSYGDDPVLFAEGVIARTTEALLQTGKDDLMVFEEIDTVLSSRKNGANLLIGSLLQATSGLITMGGKLVIVSNVETTTQVDSALLRSSRCFRVINFRNLNQEEANAAAVALGVPSPEGEKDYSLAEIMAGRNPGETASMGFTS